MRIRWLAVAFGLAVALPCGAAPIPAQERIVILVTVDGLPRISNVDVAPTLAELLGVRMPQTDGRILRELLR